MYETIDKVYIDGSCGSKTTADVLLVIYLSIFLKIKHDSSTYTLSVYETDGEFRAWQGVRFVSFFLDISDQELADKILGPQQTKNKTKRTQNHRKAAGKVET